MYNTKNYTEQGGAKTVIGGELEIKAGATITGLDASATAKGLVKQAANIAAVTPAGAEPTALETAVNNLLAALKTAGIMVADE